MNNLDIPVRQTDIVSMLELEAAMDRILALLPPAQPDELPPSAAHRRVFAEQVRSLVDLPGFNNSAVDGYAVRSADLRAATASSPVSLPMRGRVAAGETFSGEVPDRCCVRIFTGSPVSGGADAVVMQEDTRPDSASPGNICFLDAVGPRENVRFRGEDIKSGAVLGEPGELLTAGRIALLTAAGVARVRVGRCPVVGLVATGSELLEPSQPPVGGKIYESNRAALAALAADAGAAPKIFPLVKDTAAETRSALETAFHECDIVVTSGGVSVGETDFVKSAFEELGGTLEFWKVAIRPGRPFVFGQWRGKFLFGLPGNPVSALVTFLLLVRPALLRWQGARDVTLPAHPGVLAETIPNPGDRRHFVRVIVEADGTVRSSGAQASHVLGSLARANALLDVPARTTLQAGSAVRVLRWE